MPNKDTATVAASDSANLAKYTGVLLVINWSHIVPHIEAVEASMRQCMGEHTNHRL